MESWAETLCLGLDAAVFAVVYGFYRKSVNDIQALKDAPYLESDSSLPGLVTSAPDQSIPYAVVKGTVYPLGPPLKSLNSDAEGVIQKLVLKEHKSELSRGGFWSDRERIIREVTSAIPFILYNKGIGIEVIDPLDANHLKLTTISDEYKPAKDGFLQNILGWVNGHRQRGIQNIEEMLPVGSSLTGVGTVISTKNGLKLQKSSNNLPYILTELPVSALIKHLESRSKLIKVVCLVFGGVGIVLCAKVAIRCWKHWRQMKEKAEFDRRLEELRLERLSRERISSGNIPEYQLCIVCLVNPKEVILLNCGHVCVCADCVQQLGGICPMCRMEITTFQAAYIA